MYTGLAHVIYEASKKEKYGDPFTRLLKFQNGDTRALNQEWVVLNAKLRAITLVTHS